MPVKFGSSGFKFTTERKEKESTEPIVSSSVSCEESNFVNEDLKSAAELDKIKVVVETNSQDSPT